MTDETKLVDVLCTYLESEFRGVYPSYQFYDRCIEDLSWNTSNRNCLILKNTRNWGTRFSAVYQEANGPIEYFDPWGKNPHIDVVEFFYRNNLEWTDVNRRYLLPRKSPHSAAFCAYYLINRKTLPNPKILLAEFGDDLRKNTANLLNCMPLFL